MKVAHSTLSEQPALTSVQWPNHSLILIPALVLSIAQTPLTVVAALNIIFVCEDAEIFCFNESRGGNQLFIEVVIHSTDVLLKIVYILRSQLCKYIYFFV